MDFTRKGNLPKFNVSYKRRYGRFAPMVGFSRSGDISPKIMMMNSNDWFYRSRARTNRDAEKQFDEIFSNTDNVFSPAREAEEPSNCSHDIFSDSTQSSPTNSAPDNDSHLGENSFIQRLETLTISNSSPLEVKDDPGASMLQVNERARFSISSFSRAMVTRNEVDPSILESDQKAQFNLTLKHVTVRRKRLWDRNNRAKLFPVKTILEFPEESSEESTLRADQDSSSQSSDEIGLSDITNICEAEINEVCSQSEDILTSVERVLMICNQAEPLPFTSVYPESVIKNCTKIAEGTYGEVFHHKSTEDDDSFVFKIVAVDYTDFELQCLKVLPELTITEYLSRLDGNYDEFFTNSFCVVRKLVLMKGKYPESLIQLWDEFKCKKGTYNNSPENYGENQIYISLEMVHGGESLDAYTFGSAIESYYVIIQVIYALAVAEEAFCFEHRDLHLGNVLVKKTNEENVKFQVHGSWYYVPTKSVRATVIDYTLSRKNVPDGVLYNNLEEDEEIFEGVGDLQFEIYKTMRKEVKRNWETYAPRTNILWLNYLAIKCTTAVKYRNIKSIKMKRLHHEFISKLSNLEKYILKFNSAFELAESLKDFKSMPLAEFN